MFMLNSSFSWVFYSLIQYISESSLEVLHYTTNDLCVIDMYMYLMMTQLS
jgi:hypothetical protein